MTTLDLRGSKGTLRLSPNGGTATVRSFLVLGPTGATGPGGPAGPAGAPGATGPAGPAIAADQLAALSASFTAKWQPNTAYTAGQPVVSPGGDIVTARVNFTSAATYNAANWNLSPSYALRPTNSRVVDLVSPVVIAHKGGGANLVPEETMEAYRAAAAFGAKVVDGDANLLLDGSLALMHDGTLDRTTSATGNISDLTAASFQQQTVDAGSWFGGGWGNLKPPLLSQLLGEYGNRVVMTLEAKSAGACATALVNDAKRFGVLESVILCTSFWADVPTLVASGAHTQYVMTTGTEQTPAAIAAAGVKSVAVDFTAVAMTSALISQFHAAGLVVWGYTINRQVEAAAWLAKGGDGWFSDEPVYSNGAQNGYSYRRTTDPYRAQTYYHGHIPVVFNRGVFTAPHMWGVHELTAAGWVGDLAGWACPIASPSAGSISWRQTVNSWASTTRWAGGYFGAPTDDKVTGIGTTRAGESANRALLTPAGTMQLQKFTDGVVDGTAASINTTALVVPLVLSAGLAAGAAITALPVTALPASVPSGTKFLLPGTTQLATVSATAASGATSVAVSSITPAVAVPSGALVPQDVAFTYSWSGTEIRVTRTDLPTPLAITLADVGNRGPYFHMGVSGMSADFHDFTIA